jgi:hypothetical protein
MIIAAILVTLLITLLALIYFDPANHSPETHRRNR